MRPVFLSTVLLILILGCSNEQAEVGVEAPAAHHAVVSGILTALQAGDMPTISESLADSVKPYYPPELLDSAYEQLIRDYGRLIGYGDPTFQAEDNAIVRLEFERRDLELRLRLDSDDCVYAFSISNHTPDDLRPRGEWSDLGDDTLRVQRLTDLHVFRRKFESDNQYVRLVSILSPT